MELPGCLTADLTDQSLDSVEASPSPGIPWVAEARGLDLLDHLEAVVGRLPIVPWSPSCCYCCLLFRH